MSFPVVFNIAGLRVPAHLLFETAAYLVGFQAYLLLRRRELRDASGPVSGQTHVWIVVGAIFGALFGSKILAILESLPDYWAMRTDPRVWIEGKTIVGGLLGGWIGVEIVKRLRGVRGSTGDAYVLPLVLGIAIGRIGCFLTGLSDHTHGKPTALWWGIDFGDGLKRHPTQLYEIAAVLLIGTIVYARSRKPHPLGLLFRLFLFLYLAFRFLVEFIKPTFTPYLGLSAIQIACAVGIVVTLSSLMRHQSFTPVAARPDVAPDQHPAAQRPA
jgi:prolipoprotein diacylglyceryltransferase